MNMTLYFILSHIHMHTHPINSLIPSPSQCLMLLALNIEKLGRAGDEATTLIIIYIVTLHDYIQLVAMLCIVMSDDFAITAGVIIVLHYL